LGYEVGPQNDGVLAIAKKKKDELLRDTPVVL